MGVIYQIVIAGGSRTYIGSAQNFTNRKGAHLFMIRSGTHHCIGLRRAIAKYGIESVSWKILDENIPNQSLIEREQFWMDQNKGRLYNASLLAGSMRGFRKTAKQKEKSAKFHRGRKRTPETKELLRKIMLDRIATRPDTLKPQLGNPRRDAHLLSAYFSCASLEEAGRKFSIKAPATWHAIRRAKARMKSGLIANSPMYEGAVLPTRVHPEWMELAF